MKLRPLLGIVILLSGIFNLPTALAQFTLKGNYEISPVGGGGGGGGGPSRLIPAPTPTPIFGHNVYNLGPSLLIDILKKKELKGKTFLNLPLFLVPSLITTGIYPSPTSPLAQGIIETPIKSIGETVKAVKGIEVVSKESIDRLYKFSAEKVLEKYPSADVVIISTREPPVDSMAAVAYAKSIDAPILLTEPDDAPEDTINAVKRLNPKKIVIIGGPVAVSRGVESEFKKIAPIERIWGQTRYETAVEIAKRLDPDMVIITDGEAPSPDTVIVASEYKAPILYVSGKELPKPTRDFLVKHTKTKDGDPMSWVTVGIDKDVHTEIQSLYVLPEFLTKSRFIIKLYQLGTRFSK